TLVIGNTENDGAVDSIAGTGLITKTGSGDLVLNADNNDFTGEMQIENGEVTLGRSNSLMNVGDTHCQDDPQDCYGLTIGSIDKYQNQAELNVGSTQQTFVHSLTGFQNGTLNIDAGGNVTVNQGSFAGTIEGAGQLTIAQNGSYVLSGAQSMALTGDIVVDDGAVLSLEGDAADLAALQDDPQSIVLNGGVLDLSDFSTWQSGTSYNDGLEVSGSSGTVIGSQDVVDLAGGDNLHIGGDGKDGVYVVVDASDGQVSLANNNSYLGTTQIASGTLMVSDNSQLGDTHYNRQVIFTDKQQESVMEITANVDTRSTTTEHGRDIEMRADGEVAVDAGVDTQWGALMADSSGQHQDEGSTFTKTGAGTLELTASGTTQSAVRVEEGTLKGDVADIFPYASSLWVGDGAAFVTGADQDIQSIDATSSGTIDISDGTVLRLTGQDTSVALNASLFNGDGTLVNATDGVTLTGELNTNLETDSLTYLADVTVNGDLTNTSGAVSLQNGVAGDTLTVNGDYTGGGTLLLDSELNGDDSVSDQLVMNGNTAGNTTVVVNSITGIGEPTSTGIKVVDFAADPTQFQNNAQFSLAGSGYVNMGAYDYTLVEDNNDWYLRSQEVTPPSPPNPN
ncbi:autotransporter outer membrane beta-barrel domain-containing protein, partial [Shigella sonnei]